MKHPRYNTMINAIVSKPIFIAYQRAGKGEDKHFTDLLFKCLEHKLRVMSKGGKYEQHCGDL